MITMLCVGCNAENPGPDNKPGTEEPGTGEPGTGEPGTGEPGTGEPGTGEPEPPGPFFIYGREVTPNAKRLMNYMEDLYGQKIISGVMDAAWTTNTSNDMVSRIYEDTDKYPALKGFDFINRGVTGYPDYAGQQQIDEAIEWWEGKNRNKSFLNAVPAKLLPDKPDIHGIITFCWHWKVPVSSSSSAMDFYSNATDFRIPMKNNQLDTDSNAFKNIIKPDLDKVAALLQQLKDKNIPVLWRPLHEASGGWFWWGGPSGSAAYLALWEYMYNYFTNEKGLDNLIWVWNGQNASWFPNNPATADMVGFDYYTNANSQTNAQNYNSPTNYFNNTKNMVPNKDRMVAMTENGAIPDPVKCKDADALWLFFMVWNDSTGSTTANKDNFWRGGYHNTLAHKKYVFDHDLVITLDELPDLTKYRLE
jgi:mannan endo-1,4-beta-mannosidase